MSGNSLVRAEGSTLAPESRWAPGTLPFSITATGTSPSFSVSSGSSSSSCMILLAQASPAGPPPTIAMPTSMRSSSASVGGPITSAGSNGGGNSLGEVGIACSSAALLGLDRLGQLGDDLVQVAHHAEIRELENRRVLILVDREDVLRALHPDLVLDRAGDAGGQVELRRDRLAGLTDLGRVGIPAGVDHGTGGRNRAAHRLGQFLALLEALGSTEAATATDEDLCVLDVDVGATLLAALD